ncbi:MAG: M24 family metallopeptidase [Bacillota bacterium]
MKTSNRTIAKEKLDQAVVLLNKHNIDTWMIVTREGSDPSLPLLVGTRSIHQAVIFLNRHGRHKVVTSVSDKEAYVETELFEEVIIYEASIDDVFLQEYKQENPKNFALNISKDDHLCDGLTLGLYKWLERVLGKEELQKKETSSEEILKELRSVKSTSELKAMQRAIDLTTDIYEEIFQLIKHGMTEKEIGQLFVEGMKKRGVTNGLGNPYDPPLVCTVRNGLAHRKPGDYVAEPGDIVIIDFSLKYEDYVSDIARTCYLFKQGEKEPPADVTAAFEAAFAAITESIEALLPGKKGYEVDAVGRACIERHGYPTIRHSVGHQVGRETHDGGTILGPRRTPPRKAVEGTIRVGEVYAIEPTVIQDEGLPCMLVEENVLVTENGPKILSKRQTSLITIPYE